MIKIIKNISLGLLAMYSILIIAKSLVTLIIIYSNNEYYNWDFQMENASSVLVRIHLILFYTPLGLLILLAYPIYSFSKIKKMDFIIGFILSILAFRFINIHIRDFFIITSNPRLNTFISLIIYLFLLIFSVKLIKFNNKLDN